MASTEIMNGFRIFRTNSHAQTIDLYDALTKALEEGYAEMCGTGASSEEERLSPWAAFVAKVAATKRMDNTIGTTWALMLMAVPGVGSEVASAIAARFPTPLALSTAYAEAGPVTSPSLLAMLPLPSSGGARVVGAVASNKVYEVMK